MYPPPFPNHGKGGGSGGYTPRRLAGDSTAGAGRKGQAAASGGAVGPLDGPLPTALFYPRRRGIYTTRAIAEGRSPSGQNVSKWLLVFFHFLRGLCQLGRLFLFPLVQQADDLLFHFGRSNLLAEILFQFSG